MPKISKKEVLHMAKLANLKINDNELDMFSDQLSKILEYVNNLNQVDTKDTQPTDQTTGLTNVTSNDVVDNFSSLKQTEALSMSNKSLNGYFSTDPVLKERKSK